MINASPLIRFAIVGLCTLVYSGSALDGLEAGEIEVVEGEQVLLLQNGNVLRGRSEKQGDQVILHRPDGSQLRLPDKQVAHVAGSVEELYRYRASNRSFRSPSQCVEDVRWCLRHGLLDAADVELKELSTLDPTHPESARLQRQLDAARAPHVQTELPTTTLDLPDDYQASAKSLAGVLPEGVSAASIAAFASRVQPLLINRCANAACHRSGSETPWQINTLGFSVRVSSRMSQQNLAATMPYINVDDPLASKLLQFASTPHANGSYAPTSRHMHSAVSTLRDWLSQLGRYPQPFVASGPNHLPTVPDTDITQASFQQPPFPSPTRSEPVPENFSVNEKGELIYDPADKSDLHEIHTEPSFEGSVPAGWPAPIVPLPLRTAKHDSNQAERDGLDREVIDDRTGSRPKRLPMVADPFSAELFNRQLQKP